MFFGEFVGCEHVVPGHVSTFFVLGLRVGDRGMDSVFMCGSRVRLRFVT